MLTITIPEQEMFNDVTQEFYTIPSQTISLEHSLLSISKWEQKYKKPFFKTDFTVKEFVDYVRCMTLTQNVKPSVYAGLSKENVEAIKEYMADESTATTISERPGKPKPRRKEQQQTITSELIYGWMVVEQIPFECQKWHINRLIMLIRVVQELNNPEKMDRRSALKNQAALNKARKAKHHTRG